MDESDFQLLMRQLSELRGYLMGEWDCEVRPLVTITGGEPLLHPEFQKLAFMAWNAGFEVAVLTNGHLVDASMAAFLGEMAFVQVSLDGDREQHDSIRGPGDYDRVMASIRTLAKAGAYVTVSFTAHAGNYLSLPTAARAAKRAGAKRFWSDRYLPLDATSSLTPLDDAQTAEWLGLLGRASRGLRSVVVRHRALQFLCGGSPYRCHAGRDLMAVTETCDVLPCRRLPLSCGDFRNTPLAAIYEADPMLVALRDFGYPAACACCQHAAKCGGGLRCLSASVSGDWRSADPGCPILRVETSDASGAKHG